MNKVVELIKAEIERLKQPFKKEVEDNCYPAYYCALLDIEDFINSLPEDSKFRVGDYIRNKKDGFVTSIESIDDKNYYVSKCQAFIPISKQDEWELYEEPVSEDLSEYINELSKQFPEVSFAKLSRIAVRVAKWKEQQMMKRAVDVTVTDIRTYKEENEVDFTVMLDKGIIPYELEEELKVIIIKEK